MSESAVPPGGGTGNQYELLQYSPDAIIICAAGRITFANPAARLLFHPDPDSAAEDPRAALEGRSALELVPSVYRAVLQDRFTRLEEAERGDTRGVVFSTADSIEIKIHPGERELDTEWTFSLYYGAGETYVIAAIRDITRRKRVNNIIRQIAAGVSYFTDSRYYHFLVGYLVDTLDVEFAYVGDLRPDAPSRAIIVAGYEDGELISNQPLDLNDTPEAAVIARESRIFTGDLAESFPGRSLLREQGIQSFVGVPLYSLSAEPFGYIAVMSRGVMDRADEVSLILEMFAARTSAEMERTHAQAERRAQLETLALLNEAVIEMDANLKIRNVSESWVRLMRGRDEAAVGMDFSDFIHIDYKYYLHENLERLLRGERAMAVLQFPIPIPNAPNRWIEGKFLVSDDWRTGAPRIRGVIRDVTLEHLSEKQFNFLAYHDNLTGLPNRNRMEENLYRHLARAEQDGGRVAVGFIDMDNFNQINDQLGHKVGDRVLLYMAERLQGALGGGEKLFRWGGDKFVCILTEVEDNDTVRKIARLLLGVCREPIEVDDEQVHAAFSIGFAVYPEDGITGDVLLGQADRAVSFAKTQGRHAYQLALDISRKVNYQEQLNLRTAIALAIQREEFEPYFQPKVKAGSHKIIGMEALARWPSSRDSVGPGVFIPVAENMGLVHLLGDQIMEKSLRYLGELKKSNHYLNVSVNVSRRQLLQSDFVGKLLELLETHGINPFELTLEITESLAILDMGTVLRVLRRLREAGFVFSIDDFGTGYSSLSQLHQMPVSELKVDMSFIRRLHTVEGLKMVEAITNMGRALNLTMVAEGVEDLATAQRLEELGIQILQGYYFGKPLPADEFTRMLDAQRSPA